MRLESAELASRLEYDLEVVSQLRSPALGEIRAFASEEDRRAGRRLDPSGTGGRHATVYTVDYRFPVLVSRTATTPLVAVRFDLLSGGNYPFTAPWTTAISRPTPWSPHVLPAVGTICIGDIWRDGRGKMLLADLVVHVMHLLNFDENDRGFWYSGWNAAAIEHWRTVMRRKPLHPDLAYPVMPTHLTHGAPEPDCSFTPVALESSFAPIRPAPPAPGSFAEFVAAAFDPVRTR